MKGARLTLRELGRLLEARRNWLFAAIFILTPVLLCTDLFGLGSRYFYGTMSTVLILQPARVALSYTAFAAVLLTLLELRRLRQANVDALVYAVTSPVGFLVRQVTAILALLLLSSLVVMAVLLPYTAAMMGGIFPLGTYLAVWFFLYWGGLAICVLAAAALYTLTHSLEAGFIAMGVLILLENTLAYNAPFLSRWLGTAVASLSDATGSQSQLHMLRYTRLTWGLAALGLFGLSLAGTRRYGKGLAASLLYTFRRNAPLPVAAALLLCACGYLAVRQPFMDNGPMIEYRQTVDTETGVVTVQTDNESLAVHVRPNRSARFSNGQADIAVYRDRLEGKASYQVRVAAGGETEQPLLLAPGFVIREALLDGEPLSFYKEKDDSFKTAVWYLRLPSFDAAATGTLEIAYDGSPRNQRNRQVICNMITERFVFLDRFFPMPNENMDIAVACTVTLPDMLTPFVTYAQSVSEGEAAGAGRTRYAFTARGYEWLIAGDYVVEPLEAGGLDIQFVYFRHKADMIRESGAADVLAGAIDFFSEKFGRLSFGNKPFILLELDASVGAGWAVDNISMYSETMYPAGNYKASGSLENIEGGSGLGTAVHEIAHQWWGFGPSSVYVMEDDASPWSGEGLTCYSTYLYMKHLYGEAYARQSFLDVWLKNTARLQNAFYLTHREYLSRLSQDEVITIYGQYGSIARYDLMPAMLMEAERLCGGEDAFLEKLAELRRRYQGRQVSYEMFLTLLGLEKEALVIE